MPRNKKGRKKFFNRNQKVRKGNSVLLSDFDKDVSVLCRQCGRNITRYKAGPDSLCQICGRLETISQRGKILHSQPSISCNDNTFDSRRNGSSSSKQSQSIETWDRKIYRNDTPRNSSKLSHEYKPTDESYRTVNFKNKKTPMNNASLAASNLTNDYQASNRYFQETLVNPYEYPKLPAFSDANMSVYSNEFSNRPVYAQNFSNAPAYAQNISNAPVNAQNFSIAPVNYNEFSNVPINSNEELIAQNSRMMASSQHDNSSQLYYGNSSLNQISNANAYPNLKRKRNNKNLASKRAKYSSHSSSSSVIPDMPQYDQLNKNMWNNFMENHQTENIFLAKLKLRSKLQSILEQDFIDCELFLFGSSMTGFASKTSDIDLCLMFHDLKIARARILRLLWNLKSMFSRHHFLSKFEVIRAKVPIIKFKDRHSGFEIDLNINNPTGIRNSQLLRSYSRLDERVRPLILGTKWWARIHNINDAKTGTLSSYSLGLMVLHYLQYGCSPPVIPSLQVLQPDKYRPDSDVRNLKRDEDLPNFKSENRETVGQLFVGFLHYYSKHYNYEYSRISVRLGKLLPRVDKLENKDKQLIHWIDIEEPFELTNTARTVNTAKNASYIKSVFDNCYNTVDQHGSLGLI